MKPTAQIKIALLLLVLISLCWTGKTAPARAQQSPPSAEDSFPRLTPPKTPIRALQVISFDCENWDQVDQRLAAFKEAGVQAVILRVFQNEGDGFYKFIEPKYKVGVYFNTRHAPVVADVLGPVIKLAHKHGLLLLAWMTTRYANYGRESDEQLRCMTWDFDKKKAVPVHGYSPLLPEAQDRITEIWTDMARYPIDGVLIQDDLVLKHTEGMNPRARQLYFQATGKQADPNLFYKKVRKDGDRWVVGVYTNEFTAWCRWKNSVMLRLAERLRRVVQSQRPKRPVGINMFYESLTKPEAALSWYSQDLGQTLDSDLDFYAFMLYHRQMQEEMKVSREAVLQLVDDSLGDLVKKVDYPQRVWIKVQSVDWNTGVRIPHAEMAEMMGVAKKHGPVGLVVIPAKKSLDLAGIKESFR